MTLFLLAALSTTALADGDPALLTAWLDGTEITLPHQRTDLTAWVDGDLASVRMQQRFHNPTSQTLDVRYVFPLPEDAAVHGMVFDVGDRRITGEIREKAQAEQAFQQANAEGKQAAMVSQNRANVFTQQIANVPPGATVTVELDYAHAAHRIDGSYELVVPMVVGNRYQSAQAPLAGEPAQLTELAWTVGSTPTPPTHLEAGAVFATVHLNGGAPLTDVHSVSHPVSITQADSQHATVTLPAGKLDNRDLVLRYRLSQPSVAVAQSAYAEDGHGVVSLLIEPPSEVGNADITPREMVFVLDCSGSMGGAPMAASKRFMSRTLRNLRPTDTFRLIRFASVATPFDAAAVPATPANIAAAQRWVDALSTSGGTEMSHGIRAALTPPVAEGTLRNVIFLTDGYIGHDAEVVRLTESLMGESRLFAFGVGRSVNRWLIQELARVGRGSARIVLDSEQAPAVAEQLADKLATPVLTDIRVDWGDAPVRQASPEHLPDLYAGDSVRVLARFDKPGTYPVTVHGMLGGRAAALPVQLTLPEQTEAGRSLPTLWARATIEDRMQAYLSPTTSPDQRSVLQAEVTTLGLEHTLATQWTSWLAIDPRPAPIAAAAPTIAAPPAWSGHGTPEPGTLAGLALLGALGLLGRRRSEDEHDAAAEERPA